MTRHDLLLFCGIDQLKQQCVGAQHAHDDVNRERQARAGDAPRTESIAEAIQQGASDIHFEPEEGRVRLRFRRQ